MWQAGNGAKVLHTVLVNLHQVGEAGSVHVAIGWVPAHSVVPLAKRQAEVAFLVLQGHSSMSIGLRLGISTQTVKVFRKQLYKRCGVSSQAELFSLLLPVLTQNSASITFPVDA